MNICVAQTKPVKGNIEANIYSHTKLISLAVANGAGTIIFPELSLTGYEPQLAKALAIGPEDSRLNIFQEISNKSKITIGTGMPTKTVRGICISMLVFQPNKPVQTYSKKYLHADEEPFFVSGQNDAVLINSEPKIAPAICYELSVPEHPENAFKAGAKIYIASVAKTVDGIEKAVKSLSEIAVKYSMTVLMANCTGRCDNFDCGGRTSAWNNKGTLLGQLNNSDEGILVVDTLTQQLVVKTI